MPEKRRKYDREFREGAVRIVYETGKPVAQVARDLGVNEGTLGNWVVKDRAARNGLHGLSVGGAAELKRLRAEKAICGWNVMSSSDPWSCGCYPEFGITPTMPSTGLCRVRAGIGCQVRDSCVRARHNPSRPLTRLLSIKHIWRAADYGQQGDAGAGGWAIGPVYGRVPDGVGRAW